MKLRSLTRHSPPAVQPGSQQGWGPLPYRIYGFQTSSPSFTVGGNVIWKTVWRFSKKLKIELPYNPAIPLPGTYLKKTKTVIQKIMCTLMFTAALFTIGKTWKQLTCSSTDEWIKKMWYIYIILPFVTARMDLEGIMPSEISQAEKDKYHMVSLTCGI